MNNLLPSELKYHWKFDLKGSTYKRRASPAELSKSSPTYKDLDFEKIHPEVRLTVERRYRFIFANQIIGFRNMSYK